MYYKSVPLEEGILVQFVGVHVVRWRQEYGEPTIAFIEDDSHDDLLAACEAAEKAIDYLPEEALGYAQASDGFHQWPIRNELLNNLRAAIAKAKGD